MQPILTRPSKIRKRANKACLACRARKVRCDVSQRGRPCMNCFLDSESCVVVDRASRRRKSTEEDVHGDAPAGNASTQQMHRHGSVYSDEGPEQADDDVCMEATSEGGSHGLEKWPRNSSGFSIGDVSSSARRPVAQATSPNSVPQHEQPHHLQSSIRARTKKLQWAGEQSTLFGSEVTYSYYAFLEVSNMSRVLPQDVCYLEMQGCLRIPTQTILDEFVKQYFLHVHPIMPLINEGDFWETYGFGPPEGSVSRKMSLLLFQAMLFAACAYVPRNTVRALGFPDMKTARAAFYRRAKLIFDFEAELSPVAIAQAALLLSSWSPPPERHCTQTGSFWLGVAIQQGKLAGAHRYKSLGENSVANSRPAAAFQRRNVLKRLWWCTIVSDRMLSLCMQKPMQVTILHFNRDDLRDRFTLADFVDEIERSRVYNPGAKRTLIQVFMQMTKLAALLTDLLVEVLPQNEVPQWGQTFSGDDKNRIAQCKDMMELWYEQASRELLFQLSVPSKESMGNASEHGRPKPPAAAEFSHDSVVLYTNLLCLIYQSAMVKLCHYECLRMVAQARRVDMTGTALSEKRLVAKEQHEVQQAAYRVVLCLTTLAQNRLTRWLPLNLIACVSLPLILNIIDIKMSPHQGIKIAAIHDLYESVRAYQPQLDTTDWVADSIRQVFDLSGVGRPDQSAVLITESEDLGTLHPSLYLRLAMFWTPDLEESGSMGERTLPDVGLMRILGPGLIDRIRSTLGRDAQARRVPLTRPSVSVSTAEDQAMRQRIAAWQAHDHAVSSELGFDPSHLAVADAGSAENLGPSSTEDEQLNTIWKDVADRAFSEEGDAREDRLLDAFVFRDQTARPNGVSQGVWSTQEGKNVPLDREAHSVSPESAQDGEIIDGVSSERVLPPAAATRGLSPAG